jgi:hypothetical protein
MNNKIAQEAKIDFDVKSFCNEYIPILPSIIEGDFGCESLRKNFNKQFKKYYIRNECEGKFKLRVSFYSIVLSASR